MNNNFIKKAMGKNYEKVIWVFKDCIENRIDNFGLVFEYKSKICLDDVISLIEFEKTNETLLVSLYFKIKKEKKKISEVDLKEKNPEKLILKALYNENKDVLLGDLFILDKVMMYYTHNKMFEEFKKLMMDNREKGII
ncbi:hypothetical protein [Campylobacter estrildidarum]|uniref:Uncharacterized protein n=1 Tax=Campylobacter estrildidarum TaxID=2510189 RepID=A0A4U7BLJ9_9BACT|nr:hypothetical protein [Campylobacter estrildidarum]TKX28917.1 hypothetical protein CQA69_07875 [Campylobacter estrildidarum]